jgi:sorbitol-specific phosphotransferase system component IIBC
VIWIIVSIAVYTAIKYFLFNNCICKVSGLWGFLIAVLICSYPLLFWTVAFLHGASESEKVRDNKHFI